MRLRVRARRLAERWGVDLFGVADLSSARDAIVAQGGPVVARYPRAISLGMVLPHSIVDQLPQRGVCAVAASYAHHATAVEQHLDVVGLRLTGFLRRQGHGAMPIPAARQTDDRRICGVFSHKLAARLAGLGWIGKSCLLVTPEAGPRVCWTTVLTDAPLGRSGEPTHDRCGGCVQCVAICPVGAFTGRSFCEGEPREARFDARECARYFSDMEKRAVRPCVRCVCMSGPFGRR